ncbi:alanine--tRNA ligase [candidate division CSSED10-310 bacterium]|uniref:Alanine--tRNA ligase n=1 Tax=candidate division CSSED10-310 bacterium TaxID=2855610 RepID=A0ABV6YTB9_UNCC1
MNQFEIRQHFIDFFKEKHHLFVPSDSLIPRGDKTLLFTNAGMNQFKDIFLNQRKPPSPRIVNSQKCMRVSGKHNDLEDVGRDTYHHTFFEMLGNWSFGDYYKKEAILFAWELMTAIWQLPKEKLWATYYKDDEEARQIWADETDINQKQILPFDEKDNFWEMGETGPCGPCSEIHIDLGSDFCHLRNEPDHHCGVNMNCPRFIELWNLVFIQYNKDGQGTLSPLPYKHIDTGMGFERLVAVLQGKKSNYDTDIFRPLISHIEEMSNTPYGQEGQHNVSMRVIADHIRAVTFLISDGIFPSNEGRGYVLRRILRRAVRHGKLLELTEPFLYQLASTCIDTMAAAYPELKEDPNNTILIIKKEEERFRQTLHRGLFILEGMIEKNKQAQKSVLSGQDMFLLYDTYGFPSDLTKELLEEHNIGLDESGFQEAMALQKAKGRSSWEGTERLKQEEELARTYQDIAPTVFVGYQQVSDNSNVIALFLEGQPIDEAPSGMTVECLLDKTPFYGEAGGQVGDIGLLTSATGSSQVLNTTRTPQGHFIHHIKVEQGTLSLGDTVTAKIDTQRRDDIRRNHTSTHLLHAVLREILGDHVRQAGSLVSPDHFRFDFTHFERISQSDLVLIEREINRLILANIDVHSETTSFDTAVQEGAMALFDEKYASEVRMIRIPGISLELCGGTHVHKTGDIGLLKIRHEGGIAAGIRRIEAITGKKAHSWIVHLDQEVHEIASLLKTSEDRLKQKISCVLIQNKELEKEIVILRNSIMKNELRRMMDETVEINGIKVVINHLHHMDTNDLRSLCDQVKQKIERAIIILASERAGKVIMVAAVTAALIPAFHAGKLVNQIARMLGGGGGGRADFAQAGGKFVDKIDEVLAEVPDLITQLVK